jgi:hypothetical protein
MNSGNSPTFDAYDKLKENILIIMKNYYAASKRLNLHNVLSQWTLSLLSVGLIVVPLLTVTKMHLRYTSNIIDFASISLAIVVLVLSLLIGSNNYAVRGERMYQAGLELNELIRDIRYFDSDSNRMAQYQDLSSRYGNILRRYENVKDIDHLHGQININRNKSEAINLKIIREVKYYFLFLLEMLIYFVPIIFESSFIILLVT